MISFTLPKWHDLHCHLRQDGFLAPLIQAQLDMGCYGTLAMPNTRPPLAKVLEADPLDFESIENYLKQILASGGDRLKDVIVPLYLTKHTTPKMIEGGAKSGFLRACKYYPPHGTTGADFGYPFEEFIKNGVFEAMSDCGVVLCTHGEEHGLEAEDYFDRNKNAEEIFYQERLPRAIEAMPDLKIVAEHLTTKTGVDLVKQAGANMGATITPQHLLYTVGHLLKGCQYHLYCLPLLKFEEDRAALREAATASDNTQFFAGTDSAPHTQKATDCGCAAGCFTGGIAPQLYAQAFEESGIDLSQPDGQERLKRFLSHNGPNWYGIALSQESFTLIKTPQEVVKLDVPGEGQVTPLPLGLGQSHIEWSIKL